MLRAIRMLVIVPVDMVPTNKNYHMMVRHSVESKMTIHSFLLGQCYDSVGIIFLKSLGIDWGK